MYLCDDAVLCERRWRIFQARCESFDIISLGRYDLERPETVYVIILADGLNFFYRPDWETAMGN